MSGVCLCFQLVGCLLMFENKQNINQITVKKSINDDSEIDENKELFAKSKLKVNSLGLRYADSNEGFNLKQIIYMPVFYVILLMHSFSSHGASFVVSLILCRLIFLFIILIFFNLKMIKITFYKDFGQTFIYDDQFLALISSLSSVLSGVGRLFVGRFVDKLPFKVG